MGGSYWYTNEINNLEKYVMWKLKRVKHKILKAPTVRGELEPQKIVQEEGSNKVLNAIEKLNKTEWKAAFDWQLGNH